MLELLVCLLIFGWWTGIDAVTITRAHVGGLFAPYTASGNRDIEQAEHLAAFMMAINEINNHSDGIYDDILPNTLVRYDVETSISLETATASFINMQSAFHRKGVSAYVSALENAQSLVIGKLAGAAGVTSLLSTANSGLFNEHSEYPYVVRTVAAESREGMAINNMVCQLAQKIVVYVSTNDEDIQLMEEFEGEPSCILTYMGTVLIPGDQVDMTSYAEAAMQWGARYFVLFLPAYQTAALLETGYEVGLFGDNTVILTSDRGSSNITAYFTPEADVANLMTGFFTFKYWPNYYINRTKEAKAFALRWKQQESTAGEYVNGTLVCNNATDSMGHYLYQSVYDNATFCTGVDFSKYRPTGIDMQPYTTLTYDATIMMLLALDYAVKDGIATPTAEQLTNYLIDSVSTFKGVSGPINLFQGYESTGYDLRGNRFSGTEYYIYNFFPTVYNKDEDIDKAFLPIGYYDANLQKFHSCTQDEYRSHKCVSPSFRSATDGSVYNAPPDSPYPIHAVMSYPFRAVLAALALLLLIEVCFLVGVVWWYRNTKVLKASQPFLLASILLGGFVAAVRVAAGGFVKNQANCVTEVWLGHFAFILMVGALLVKSYRVHCIVNTKKLRKVTFSGSDALKMLAVIIVLTGVYLIVLTSLGVPVLRHEYQIVRNQETIWKYCTLEQPQWQTALYFFEAALLAYGFRICWEIRNVPDLVNESKQISTAMSSIVLVSVLVIPIVYFLGLPVYTREFVASFGFAFGAMGTLTLLFLPKLVVIYCTGGHAPKIHASEIVIPGGVASASSAARKKYATNNMNTGGAGSSTSISQTFTDTSMNYRFSRDLLRHKSREERLVLVQEQIYGWQVLLMHEQRHALNFSSSSDDDKESNNNNNNNLDGGGERSRSIIMQGSSQGRSESIGGPVLGGAAGAAAVSIRAGAIISTTQDGGQINLLMPGTSSGENASASNTQSQITNSEPGGVVRTKLGGGGSSKSNSRSISHTDNSRSNNFNKLEGHASAATDAFFEAEALKRQNSMNSRASNHSNYAFVDNYRDQHQPSPPAVVVREFLMSAESEL